MNKCKTCRHWSSTKIFNEDVNQKMAECTAVYYQSLVGDDGVIRLAYVKDYEGYCADLVTAEEFGCVMHEERQGEA